MRIFNFILISTLAFSCSRVHEPLFLINHRGYLLLNAVSMSCLSLFHDRVAGSSLELDTTHILVRSKFVLIAVHKSDFFCHYG